MMSVIASAAAAAAAVAGFASAPVGVGALMTETQCAGAVLFGTEEELAASPRADTSTEAVAAGIDGAVVASQVRSELRSFRYLRVYHIL